MILPTAYNNDDSNNSYNQNTTTEKNERLNLGNILIVRKSADQIWYLLYNRMYLSLICIWNCCISQCYICICCAWIACIVCGCWWVFICLCCVLFIRYVWNLISMVVSTKFHLILIINFSNLIIYYFKCSILYLSFRYFN